MSTATIHMTNTEFARQVGCDVTTVGRWLTGSRTPGIEFIDEVARVMNISHQHAMVLRKSGRFADFLRKWLETGVLDDYAA